MFSEGGGLTFVWCIIDGSTVRLAAIYFWYRRRGYFEDFKWFQMLFAHKHQREGHRRRATKSPASNVYVHFGDPYIISLTGTCLFTDRLVKRRRCLTNKYLRFIHVQLNFLPNHLRAFRRCENNGFSSGPTKYTVN